MGRENPFKGLRLPGKPPWYLWAGVIVLVVGTIFLSIGNLLDSSNREAGFGSRAPGREVATKERPEDSELFTTARALETELQAILEQVEGAGRVKVSVSLAATPIKEYATNTKATKRNTEEKDQSGGTRVTNETDEDGQLVLARTSTLQGEEPVVVRESKPQVQGVVVVAEGGNDPLVRVRLTEAVQTLWGLAPHQVRVLPMRR